MNNSDILHKNFLPVRNWNKTGNFNGFDSKELFEKNLVSQPDDWFYRNNKVQYTLNSQRYRAPEFKNVIWEDSVVIFGCSNVFGTAIDDEHTISNQLSKIINRPVINLGVAASSIQYSVFNSTILASEYPTPKAVIQLWTGYDRCMLFENNTIENYGSWNISPGNFMDLWNQNNNSSSVALIFREISKQIWDSRTVYYEATFFKSTSDLFKNCCHLPRLDYGRDLLHPGIETAISVAEHIASQIKI